MVLACNSVVYNSGVGCDSNDGDDDNNNNDNNGSKAIVEGW
jgi:hypothetical protein